MHTVGELLGLIPAENRDLCLPDDPCCKLAGKIFFYRNFHLQQRIVGGISHAKAAVADDLADDISVKEYRARRDMHCVFRRGVLREAAMRAGIQFIGVLLKAAEAKLHRVTYFSNL